jgi:hypothetical protein
MTGPKVGAGKSLIGHDRLVRNSCAPGASRRAARAVMGLQGIVLHHI